jgi:cation diffusion facilitator CzcD-associated flavoprotein CzcO
VSTVDVAIVGSGPYGLSCAAHLRSLDLTLLGEPMSFWRDHMPAGMFLRSPRQASSLAAPVAGLRLEDYEREHGIEAEQPLPLATFLDYGHWFQRQAVPEHDPRAVREVARDGRSFRLTLDDGEVLAARNVVVAAGIERFAWRPPELATCPTSSSRTRWTTRT